MSRKWHAGLFVLGAAVFAYLVARIGVGRSSPTPAARA